MLSIAAMMLVHARENWLHRIWHQMADLGIRLQVTLSSPTPEVLHQVNCLIARRGWDVQVLEAPFNPLEPGKPERFMELRNWQLARLAPSEYGVIWDDDHWLEDPSVVEHCLSSNPDLVYATKTFFWDNLNQVATHIPTHRSVFFFKRTAGEHFPLDRTINAPLPIHDTANKVLDLPTKLLDFGYLHEGDRFRCWNEYKGVGKIDASTLALLSPPKLESYRC